MSAVWPTRRGALVLGGAVAAYLVGWAFGTRELAALSLALAASVALAFASVVIARRTPRRLARRLPPRAVADEPLEIPVLVAPAARLVAAVLVERCGGLGVPKASLRRGGDGLEGAWRVERPARGRYELAPELVLEDVLGLVRARVPLPFPALLRVEPRLVQLGDGRARAVAQRDGTRRALAANAGDGWPALDHEVGESLRRVHWRTTARRGRLTVRELEEHPREELHVLLDASLQDAARVLRPPAFERAVQCAGSLALQLARTGAAVTFESRGRHGQRVAVSRGSVAALFDALCTVEADGIEPLASQLARLPGSRLCVVTSDLGPAVVERLLALAPGAGPARSLRSTGARGAARPGGSRAPRRCSPAAASRWSSSAGTTICHDALSHSSRRGRRCRLTVTGSRCGRWSSSASPRSAAGTSRLQSPAIGFQELLLPLLLALLVAAAALYDRRALAAASVLWVIAAAALAGRTAPSRADPLAPFSPALDQLRDGIDRFAGVVLPFDPVAEPGLHRLVLTGAAVWLLALALVWLVAARPLPAVVLGALPVALVSTEFPLPRPGLRIALLVALVVWTLGLERGVGPAPGHRVRDAARAARTRRSEPARPGPGRVPRLARLGKQGRTAAVRRPTCSTPGTRATTGCTTPASPSSCCAFARRARPTGG